MDNHCVSCGYPKKGGFCSSGCAESPERPRAQSLDTVKLSLSDWMILTGIEVWDPDGFDRTDPNVMSRGYTFKEFEQGSLRSTCMFHEGSIKGMSLISERYQDKYDDSRRDVHT